MLFIVSMKGDGHVTYMYNQMDPSQQEDTIIFETESFPTNTYLSLNSETDCFLHLSERNINLRDISSVWYRRPAKPIISDAIQDADLKRYAREESWDTLLGIWESMRESIWVSRPSSIRSASYKWEQLQRAKQLGFTIPRTLITNNPVEARQFCHLVGSAIVKAVSKSVFPRSDRHYMAYTTPITADNQYLEHRQYTPCIFQEYVPKRLELRITVVGEKLFSCAIHSQATAKTLHDWRHYDLKNTPHTPWHLPKEIEERCMKLVKSYHLNFGAIDMIFTPNNEYVFLELNSNGQWLWIEEMTGLPICQALINFLFQTNQ